MFTLTENLEANMKQLAVLENRFVYEKCRLHYIKAFEINV